MQTKSRFFSSTRRLLFGGIGACALLGAASSQAFECHTDMYAALLTRLVENTTDDTVNPANADFLDATQYWQTLWDTCSSSDVWQQLMANAEIISAEITEFDGSSGTTRALVSITENANRVAWIAFPGATTGSSFESGYRSAQWGQNSAVTRHFNYHEEFEALFYQGSLNGWIAQHDDEFDHVIVTGHSKGAVMSQFLLESALHDKQVYLTAFGSPHAGNEAYIREQVCSDIIVRGKFYLTYFDTTFSKGNYDFIESKRETIDHDLVSLEGVNIKSDGGLSSTVHYPRGMSSALQPNAYLDTYCAAFDRVNIKVDHSASSLFTVNSVYDRMTIHGISYYLSALEDAADSLDDSDICCHVNEAFRWTFDETSTTSAGETGGSGLNATLRNGATFTTPVAPIGDTNTKALSFDGSNDYAVIADDDRIDFGPDDDFTVAVWIKADANQAYTLRSDNDVVEKWTSGSGYPFVIRYINQNHADNGKVQVARYDGSNNPSIRSQQAINDGQFHHIAFIKQGETLKLYVDGVLNGETTDTTSGTTGNNSPLYLGRRGSSSYANFFEGAIDDLRIHNYAITDTELQALTQHAPTLSISATLKNFGSDKCLTVANNNQSNGANIYQADCDGSASQRLTFTPVLGKNGVYTLVFEHSGKCVDVANKGILDHVNVLQWDCHAQTHQQFNLTYYRPSGWVGADKYKLIAAHSGKALTVENSDSSGANVIQLSEQGNAYQEWYLLQNF